MQDAVDVLLLRDLIPGLAAARAACVDVFAARGTHPWPPTFTPQPGWAGRFAELAKELEMEVADLDAAATELRGFIAAIDRAPEKT